MPYYIMQVLSLNQLVSEGSLVLIHFLNVGDMEQGGMKI